MAVSKANMLELFFPGIGGHVKSPDVPFQYTQSLILGGNNRPHNEDVEQMHAQMIGICIWCRENLEDEKLWYINQDKFNFNGHLDTVTFVFDFANAEDHMAFKLKWG